MLSWLFSLLTICDRTSTLVKSCFALHHFGRYSANVTKPSCDWLQQCLKGDYLSVLLWPKYIKASQYISIKKSSTPFSPSTNWVSTFLCAEIYQSVAGKVNSTDTLARVRAPRVISTYRESPSGLPLMLLQENVSMDRAFVTCVQYQIKSCCKDLCRRGHSGSRL